MLENIQLQLRKGEKSILSDAAIDTLTVDDMASAYKKRDPLCRRIIEATAQITAEVIISLCEMLDFSNVIIHAPSMILGHDYVDVIAKHVNNYNDVGSVDFYLSSYNDAPSVKGALYYASQKAIADIAFNGI